MSFFIPPVGFEFSDGYHDHVVSYACYNYPEKGVVFLRIDGEDFSGHSMETCVEIRDGGKVVESEGAIEVVVQLEKHVFMPSDGFLCVVEAISQNIRKRA